MPLTVKYPSHPKSNNHSLDTPQDIVLSIGTLHQQGLVLVFYLPPTNRLASTSENSFPWANNVSMEIFSNLAIGDSKEISGRE